MTTQEEFEQSRQKLEELAERHRKATVRVGELKIALDDAGTAAMKARAELDEENERYMVLEKKMEAENATTVS